MHGRDRGARGSSFGSQRLQGKHGTQARDRSVTAASISWGAAAFVPAGRLLGGRLRLPGGSGVLDRTEQPLWHLRAARAPVIAHRHDRLRGLRGRDGREPPVRRARLRLVRPARSAASSPRSRGCRGSRLPDLEIADRPARRACAHRPFDRCRRRDRHRFHHRPGRRHRRRAHAPSHRRGHNREYRRSGGRSADCGPTRSLRA
jgi:hypothetical protein